MGRRSTAKGRLGKARRTLVSKARKAPTAADLQKRLDEAFQQQTATSEVLGIIRRSPADAQPVFDAIVQSAARLCGAIFGVVYLYDGDRMRIAATRHFSSEAMSSNSGNPGAEAARALTSRRPGYFGPRNRPCPRRACRPGVLARIGDSRRMEGRAVGSSTSRR